MIRVSAEELERGAMPSAPDGRWQIAFELHPSPAVTAGAARLVAARARAAGVVVTVTFGVPDVGGPAPTWLPPVPVVELADVVGTARVVVADRDHWCYPSEQGTLVVPVERGARGRLVALAVLQAHVDPGHCEGDGVVRSLDARGGGRTATAVRDALDVHAQRVVAELLGRTPRGRAS